MRTTNTILKCFGWSYCPRCRYTSDTTEFTNKKLEINIFKRYLTANGNIIEIISHNTSKNIFIGSNAEEYNKNGHDIRDNHHNDLIAEIPESLHFEILKLITEYYKGF